MNCPLCEKYKVLLKVVQSPDRRFDIERERDAHVRAAHPEQYEDPGLAAKLWRGKIVRVNYQEE